MRSHSRPENNNKYIVERTVVECWKGRKCNGNSETERKQIAYKQLLERDREYSTTKNCERFVRACWNIMSFEFLSLTS